MEKKRVSELKQGDLGMEKFPLRTCRMSMMRMENGWILMG